MSYMHKSRILKADYKITKKKKKRWNPKLFWSPQMQNETLKLNGISSICLIIFRPYKPSSEIFCRVRRFHIHWPLAVAYSLLWKCSNTLRGLWACFHPQLRVPSRLPSGDGSRVGGRVLRWGIHRLLQLATRETLAFSRNLLLFLSLLTSLILSPIFEPIYMKQTGFCFRNKRLFVLRVFSPGSLARSHVPHPWLHFRFIRRSNWTEGGGLQISWILWAAIDTIETLILELQICVNFWR